VFFSRFYVSVENKKVIFGQPLIHYILTHITKKHYKHITYSMQLQCLIKIHISYIQGTVKLTFCSILKLQFSSSADIIANAMFVMPTTVRNLLTAILKV